MKLLFNTSTQIFQPYPRTDDGEVVGLDPVYHVYSVAQNEPPAFDAATHYLQSTEAVDHAAKNVTRGWNVVENPVMPAPPAERYQVKEYLMRNGISLDSIPAMIASVTPEGIEREVALMRWEEVVNFPKEHPLVAAVAASLNLDLDQVWGEILAIE